MKIKLLYLIKEIYENGEILDKLIHNQRQYSDKNVYKNINQIINMDELQMRLPLYYEIN